jgi:acetyl-CoA synthetase
MPNGFRNAFIPPTEIVKAFVVLKPEATADKALGKDIKNFVKNRLAAYEYPREIEFIDELPLTATGKIIRKELRELERERK